MYHGVVRKQANHISVNHLSLKDFEIHMAYLKRNFKIVSLREMFERPYPSKTGKKTVAITFDDGYENNFTNAFPVLKKYGIPATIFVVADCVQNPGTILWYDYVDILKDKIDYALFPSLNCPLQSEDLAAARLVTNIHHLRKLLKTLNSRDKKILLEALLPAEKHQSAIDASDREYRQLLSVSQMKEMQDSGLIEIGSHSLSHPNLDTLEESELQFELNESKKLLESSNGRVVESLAFPDGAYDAEVKRMAIQQGYDRLLAVDFRVEGDKADPDILPRFCISNTTTPESNFIQVHMSFQTTGF